MKIKQRLQLISIKRNFVYIFIPLNILIVSIKLIVSSLGHNFDLDSFSIVANLIHSGKSVYINTQRYNYGPLWSYILYFLSIFRNIIDFHIVISLFLSLIDVGISYYIYKLFGKLPAILFILNPISILITGYHSQFDNLAILFGLIGYKLYIESTANSNNRKLLISSLFFGLSLITKHILFIFPLWIVFSELRLKKIQFKRLFIINLSYVLFACGFLFEIIRFFSMKDQVIEGITKNVFQYSSFYGNSFLVALVHLFISSSIGSFIVSITNLFFPLFLFTKLSFNWFTILLVVSLIVSGYIFTKNNELKKYLYLIYLMVLFSFSPAFADQYLAIPIIAVSVLYKRWEATLFIFFAAVYLLMGSYPNANIANLINYSMDIHTPLISIPLLPWYLYSISHTYSQAILFLLYLFFIFFVLKNKSINIMEKSHVMFFVNLTQNLIFLSSIILVSAILIKYKGTHFIRTEYASYKYSCSKKIDIITNRMAHLCDNRSACKYLITSPIKTENCSIEYTVRWNCSENKKIYPVFTIFVDSNAEGKEIELRCTYLFNQRSKVYDQ